MREDLSGKVFSRLTVLSLAGSNLWECLCECGERRIVRTSTLRAGHSKSCGCLRIDTVRSLNLRHGHSVGGKRSPEYRAYTNAKCRCEMPSNDKYEYYGGRGIKFLFSTFHEFLAEIGLRPSLKHSLDRIDTNGHYEKGNIRWATPTEQMSNRRPRTVCRKGHPMVEGDPNCRISARQRYCRACIRLAYAALMARKRRSVQSAVSQ